MDARNTSIRAAVLDMSVDINPFDVNVAGGGYCKAPATHRVVLTVELMPKSKEELETVLRSILDSGRRIVLAPDTHQATVVATSQQGDQPMGVGELIW